MQEELNLPPPILFPAEALPQSLRDLAMELHRNTQAPIELIVSSILGGISLACQGSVNVLVPNGVSAPSPVSLFFATLAESGDRKTTVDKIVNKPIGEFEVKQAEYLNRERVQYKADMITWNIKKKAIEKAIEIASKIGASADQTTKEPDDKSAEDIGESDIPLNEVIEESVEQITGDYIDQLKEQLNQHLSQEPKRPRNVKLMFNNASPEAILRSLFENWSSASLTSDEAGSILNGRALADLAMINKLWEGGTIHVERINSESYILRDARFSFAVMIQPKVFQKYLDRHGDEARAIGLFARCLICFPRSTRGTRFIGHVPPTWQELPKFHERITAVLNQNLLDMEDPEFTRPKLEFSPEAKQLWINAFNEVEGYLFPGQYFADIADYGSKFGENLARMAALFHYFAGEQGDISYETTNRAFAICRWYMTEFKRLFASAPELPVEISDANELEAWLIKLCRRYPGWTEIRKNVIAQLGPNHLRSSKTRREAALYVLACNNKLRFELRGKTTMVVLNSVFFPVPPIAIFPPICQSQLQW